MDGNRRNPFDSGLRGPSSRSTLELCVFNVLGKIQIAVLVQYLSNFICEL